MPETTLKPILLARKVLADNLDWDTMNCIAGISKAVAKVELALISLHGSMRIECQLLNTQLEELLTIGMQHTILG